jgi:hypothetical protein
MTNPQQTADQQLIWNGKFGASANEALINLNQKRTLKEKNDKN